MTPTTEVPYNRQTVLLAVSAGLILVAVTHFFGAGAVLLLVGIGLLTIVLIMQVRLKRKMLPERLTSIRPVVLIGSLGAVMAAFGLLIRFSPEDIGRVLAVVGVAAVLGTGLYLLLRGPKRRMGALYSDRAAVEPSVKGRNASVPSIADEFRHQVSTAVFEHAQRASRLTFGVALTLFVVGIGAFVFLGYGIYQQITPSAQASGFNQFIQSYIQYISNRSSYAPQELAFVLLLQAGRFIPLFGLLVIGWIGSRLIVNATRLSQRRVLQDTLAELGPLQSTIAGLPPRKPIADAVEQSLKQARRSFTVRTWLSIVLFGVGIVLFISLFVYGWENGFAANPIVTASVAGSGLISFVLSMVANRQSEVRETLDQIANLQLQIADRAQRSEILDLYVAQLVKEGFNADRIETLKKVLSWLGSETPLPAAIGASGAHEKLSVLKPPQKPKGNDQRQQAVGASS